MEKITLAIVDDHNLFRNGLILLIRKSSPDFIGEIYEATNGIEFLKLIDQHKIDLVLMDISMPEMNGIEATQRALEKDKNMKIIALTMFNDNDYYYKMINAGVKGFLLKESEIQEVIFAMKTVLQGNNYFPVDILCNIIKNKDTDTNLNNGLSDRELEVLKMVCQGLSNSDIARKLFISKKTVDKHRANILMKTNSKNTANLVMYAIKYNLVNV
jgi:DNA-binding NarL/FixJ family response regulator